MKFDNIEHGFVIKEDTGIYQIETVEPWVTAPYTQNEIGQPLTAGTFLMKMANIDYGILSHYNMEFITDIQNFFKVHPSDMDIEPTDSETEKKIKSIYQSLEEPPKDIEDFAFLKKESEKINQIIELKSKKVINDLEEMKPEEELTEIFENYKASLRDNLYSPEYHLSEFEQEMFAELIVCEIQEKMNLNTFAPSDSSTFMPTILLESEVIRTACISILNDKESRVTPQIASLMKSTLNKYWVDIDTMKPCYWISSFDELFVFDALRFINSDINVCHCHVCGKYFFKKKKNTEVYCNYLNKYNITCKEYTKTEEYKNDKSIHIEITRAVENATKRQHEYLLEVEEARSFDVEDKVFYNSYLLWHKDLKRKEKECRINEDIDSLNDWIKNTKFKDKGFDYVSEYENE